MKKLIFALFAIPLSLSIAHAADNIVATAQKAGQFKTLVAAIQAAGLTGTLESKGPFTVFAPTDEAFAKLPKGTVDELLKPENKQKLVSILEAHVVKGKVMAADVRTMKVITIGGSKVQVMKDGSSVMYGDANVVKADIPASNGVVHVIDAVVIPGQASK